MAQPLHSNVRVLWTVKKNKPSWYPCKVTGILPGDRNRVTWESDGSTSDLLLQSRNQWPSVTAFPLPSPAEGYGKDNDNLIWVLESAAPRDASPAAGSASVQQPAASAELMLLTSPDAPDAPAAPAAAAPAPAAPVAAAAVAHAPVAAAAAAAAAPAADADGSPGDSAADTQTPQQQQRGAFMTPEAFQAAILAAVQAAVQPLQ